MHIHSAQNYHALCTTSLTELLFKSSLGCEYIQVLIFGRQQATMVYVKATFAKQNNTSFNVTKANLYSYTLEINFVFNIDSLHCCCTYICMRYSYNQLCMHLLYSIEHYMATYAQIYRDRLHCIVVVNYMWKYSSYYNSIASP